MNNKGKYAEYALLKEIFILRLFHILNCFIFILLGHSVFTKQNWRASPFVKIEMFKRLPFLTQLITMNASSETNSAYITINSQ